MNRGQSLVELAACAPVVVLLALGTVTLVQLNEAKGALDAATEAAVGAAVQAPDASMATGAAQARFAEMTTVSGLDRALLQVRVAGFERGSTLVADSSAQVELGWGRLTGVPGTIVVHSSAEGVVDMWRSRPSP